MSDIEEIRARAAAATPGPWKWRGNVDCDDPRLVGGPRFADIFGIIRRERTAEDRETKDFAHYLCEVEIFDASLNDGKGGHRPYTDEEIDERVREDWLEDPSGGPLYDQRLAFYCEPGPFYHYARDLAVYEVCPTATTRSDPRVYRADIVGLRNPNAVFIAAARQDVDDLLAEIDRLSALLAEREVAVA